jgi:hypothetical protein
MQLLPAELMELQIAQIDLLLAMYPEEGAIVIDESTTRLIEEMKHRSTSKESVLTSEIDANQSLTLVLNFAEPEPYQISISIPLGYDDTEIPEEPPMAAVRLKQPPSGMSRGEAQMANALATTLDDVLSSIDSLQNAVTASIQERSTSTQRDTKRQQVDAQPEDGSLVRVWFYFPSISTREKRDDLINHAPGYNLTGFLVAGKPGFLLLEGASRNIDDYMKFIKTESWGDIPAHHKKVSEKYRESKVERKFEGMREVTDEIGERRGERANRTNMKALEAWLLERGFGEVMKKILI